MTSLNNTEWNPRYVNYCKMTGGLSPDATLERDRERYPGGCMCGFILWTAEMIQLARLAHPEYFYVDIDRKLTSNLINQEGYDKWLNAFVEENAPLISELQDSLGHPICGHIFVDENAGQLICTLNPNHSEREHNADGN